MTFPREYKRCMYCGGRLGVPIAPDFTGSGVVTLESELGPEPEEPASPISRFFRRGMGLVWVVAAVAAYAAQMCTGRG